MNSKRRLGLVALVVLGLVFAVSSLALNLGSSGRPASQAPATPPPAATVAAPSSAAALPSASASSVGALTHFERDGLVFDYPAEWKATVSGLNEHYITILDFLGTGSGLASCQPMTPGPGDQFIGGTTCGTDVSVGPGQVLLEIDLSVGPPRPGPIDPADPAGLQAGQKYVTVGGLPAIFEEQLPRDILIWTLSVPGQLISRYYLTAQLKGPGIETMRAQVDALVASIEYDPPAAVLVPADGPRIAAIGLTRAQAGDPDLACFPTVAGATATATVTRLPFYSGLRKPLPVTCAMKIEPMTIGLWKVTLTESWTSASDRSAGSLTILLWLEPDGSQGSSAGGGALPTEVPYWP